MFLKGPHIEFQMIILRGIIRMSVRIGMASLNPVVGSLDSNLSKIKSAMSEMNHNKCDIGCFSEGIISGYPSEDLVLWPEYIEKQKICLNEICDFTKRFPTSYIVGAFCLYNNLIYNNAVLISNGEIQWFVPKEKLPTYDVFYDGRQFAFGEPGFYDIENKFGDAIFDMPFGKIGITICEDMWVASGPVTRRVLSGAEIIFNISASPWRQGVVEARENMIRARSADNAAAIVYVNQTGGNDALVFDGGNMVACGGDIVFRSERWKPVVCFYDLDLNSIQRARQKNTTWRNDYIQLEKECYVKKVELSKTHNRNNENNHNKQVFLSYNDNNYLDPIEESVNAIILGLNDYFEKTNAFKGIGVSISGGRDSVLTALLAAEWALRTNRNPEMIKCFSMPSKYNSSMTKNIAKDISEYLGVSFGEIPITEAYSQEIDVLKKTFNSEEISPITLQNMQARIRAMRMWNISNELSLLWLQAGNMSEKATGYTTIGGDLSGGYSLLGNLPKTIVNKVLLNIIKNPKFWSISELKSFNDLKYVISLLLEETSASAELAEDQNDERDLMPFELLDICYFMFIREKRTCQEIYDYICDNFTDEEFGPYYKKGMLKIWIENFIKLFFRNIYKWVQSPQAVHLSDVDLDHERALQIPVVQSLEWVNTSIKGER